MAMRDNAEQQQIIATSSDTVNMACPPAEDQTQTLATAAASGAREDRHADVQPYPDSTTSTQQFLLESFEAQQFSGLGGALIVIGITSVILQAVSISVCNWFPIAVGYGYWCGSMFMITGCVGIGAAGKVRRVVTAFYVMCILSAVLSMCLIGLSVKATHTNSYYFGKYSDITSLLATLAIAACVASVRGIIICRRRCAVLLCSSSTSAVEISGVLGPFGLSHIEQPQQQMLWRQQQLLLQQLQPPKTTLAQSPVVVMMPSHVQSFFETPTYCLMPTQAIQQQTWLSPAASVQIAPQNQKHGVAPAAATSFAGVHKSLAGVEFNAAKATTLYSTAERGMN